MALSNTFKGLLRSEIFDDPEGLYSGITTDDTALAAALNLVREGGQNQVPREPVTKSAVWALVTPEDWNAMTPEQVQKFTSAISAPDLINLANASVLAKTINDLPPGDSRTAITLYQSRQGSRAEKVTGQNGIAITPGDVADIKEYTP